MQPKDIAELTEEDFKTSSRWMFYAGSTGEYDPFVTVIPEQHPDFNCDTLCLLKASYQFRDGSQHPGSVYTDKVGLTHTVFVGLAGFSTWFGVREPTREEIDLIYATVSHQADEIFPISFESFDGSLRGTLEGFYFLDSDQHVRFKK